MMTRLAKLVLVAAVGLFYTLVVFEQHHRFQLELPVLCGMC